MQLRTLPIKRYADTGKLADCRPNRASRLCGPVKKMKSRVEDAMAAEIGETARGWGGNALDR